MARNAIAVIQNGPNRTFKMVDGSHFVKKKSCVLIKIYVMLCYVDLTNNNIAIVNVAAIVVSAYLS